MRFSLVLPFAGLFVSGVAAAQGVPCPIAPPPPASESKFECEYILEVSLPACPSANLTPSPLPPPRAPVPPGDESRLPFESRKGELFGKTQYYTDFICAGQAVNAYLDCHYLGNDVGTCSAWPAEKAYSGFLTYDTWLDRNGGVEHHTSQAMQFYCPFGEHVSGTLTVGNGGVPSTTTAEFDCLPPPPPSPIDATTVGCASNMPGYNQVDIAEPHGYVDYFVVELKRVNYAGNWQVFYQGPSRKPIIRPQAESYVRVKACNAGGCSPYFQSPQRANPSMFCP
jgi:hypothetical protein